MKAFTRTGATAFFLFLLLPCASLAQIAPGVQQSAAHTANISGTVTGSDGTPIPGADVKLTGPSILTTQSDAHGVFNFTSVPWGTYQVSVSSGLGIATRSNVVVNGDINLAIQYQATGGLRTIAHVSTSSAGASINVTPASITSIAPSQYAFQGNTSWEQLLNRIPGVTVGGDLYEGATTTGVIPGGPFQPIVLSINGALPYETATSIDGMPIINESFIAGLYGAGSGTDLSFLPMAMFDTTDIVRGPGANAPSIVDSIGGAFVLHAPNPATSNHVEFSVSNDPFGGIATNARVALHLGRFSATLTYGFNNSPGPLGNQVQVIPGYAYPPTTVNGQPFVANYPTEVMGNKYYECDCGYRNILMYCCYPLSTNWVSHGGAAALSYQIAPNVLAQVFYSGSATHAPDQYGYSPIYFTPLAGYTGSLSAGYHELPAGDASYYINQIESMLEEKVTAYVGKGVIRVAALQNNSWSPVTAPFLYPNGIYTLYGTGYYASAPTTPVTFNGVSAKVTMPSFIYNCENWVNNRDLLGSYSLQVGANSQFGVSYVTSYYNDPQTYYVSEPSFDYTYESSRPPSVSSTTNEVRINAGTQLTDAISLDGSWYFAAANYHVPNPNNTNEYVNSNFQYNAPRLGLTWRANPNAVVRFAAGGGYALPPILYQVGTNVPFCEAPSCTVTLANLAIRPEESFSFDLGTDLRLQRTTTLSFDVYRTNLYGQFFQSTKLTSCSTSVCGGLPLYVTTYQNLTQSRYEGINLTIRHDVPAGIYWNFQLGLNRAYVVSVPSGFYSGIEYPPPGYAPTPCTNCANPYVVPGANFNGYYLSPIPYANGSAQIGYRWKKGSYLDIQPTYYGNGNVYFEPAFMEFEVHGGYTITHNISLLATLRNMTNIYPQSYDFFYPSTGAPTIAGLPYPIYGVPYGPRALIVTLNYNY